MNLRKKLVASLVVAAMSVTAAFSAFAAAGDTKTVSFYTYDEDSEEFVASSHGSSCVSSCVEDADGNYTIEFLVIGRGSYVGYISNFDGDSVEYDELSLGAVSDPFTYVLNPTVDVDGDGVADGAYIDFTVTMDNADAVATHPYSNAVIVIE